MASGFMISGAGHLHALSRRAHRRCRDAQGQGRTIQDDATVSIILSVAAAEGFINELMASVNMLASRNTLTPAQLTRLAAKWDKDGYLPIRQKYRKVATALAKPYEEEKSPFQDFNLLVDTRNTLVHFRPLLELRFVDEKTIEFEAPELIKRLSEYGLTKEIEPGAPGPWFYQIQTTAMAKWACNTSSRMVNSLAGKISFRPLAQWLRPYALQFNRV